ncbi:MAG: ATP-binding protein [candidate division KSB1 bacterium]|nr:ATP-binding protein [candidate division KSB1 bacterium]MDZ7318940.1 ATP-binding protein [candidate division KSB1 bacterium]MDZ7341492.1 ATP-binding protein [candidate division KSB1 bacterium]
MNDNHSHPELIYKPRWLASQLRDAIKDQSIVVLTGARQVGKSTLLRQELPFSNWRYINFDDFDAVAQSASDPASFWAGTSTIIFDEVQKAPNLLNAIKQIVDSKPHAYQFILSGSANLLLMQKVSESLAGRAVYFTLNPMTIGEINAIAPPNLLQSLFNGEFPNEKKIASPFESPFPFMWKGFLPPLMLLESSAAVLRWWEGYVATYLERDLRQLSQIDSLPDFRRLMVALALRCGQMLNQTEVARDTGISQPSVHRYFNLLETTCLTERLPAFTVNRTKRLIKTPKQIWSDPGLVSFLAGHYDVASLQAAREAGGIFEATIYLHLNSLAQLLVPKPRLFYWRTTTDKKVDFVLEWGRKLLAVEVKLTNYTKFSDIQSLKLFLEEYPETSAGVLIYTGNEVKQLHEKIVAIPWFLLGGYS